MQTPNKSPHRREHLTEYIKNYSGDFFARNGSGSSLITVTNVWVSEDCKHADVFISVLPDSKTEAALNFAKRQRTDLQKYIFTKIRLSHLPLLSKIISRNCK